TAIVSTNDLVLYTPAPGFTGQDQFTYRISDGHGGIASATVTVAVAGVVDTIPPTVVCPGDQTATATSPAGAVVTYVASATDAGGLASFACTPPPGSTFPFDQPTVTCTAVDLAGNSASCSFKVTVSSTPLNRPPVADASATERTVISGNNSNAVVHLDGTRSTDPDVDPLTYSWLVDGGLIPVATGATADIVLEVGMHTITLLVSDGLASDTDVIQVNVLTAAEAIDEIIAVLNAADLD